MAAALTGICGLEPDHKAMTLPTPYFTFEEVDSHSFERHWEQFSTHTHTHQLTHTGSSM